MGFRDQPIIFQPGIMPNANQPGNNIAIPASIGLEGWQKLQEGKIDASATAIDTLQNCM